MSSVYAWGSNSMHQLSHKDSLHFYEPSLFADFEGRSPVAIATGDGHSLVLTDTGEVFTFGRGKEGQLGHGQQSSNCKEPQVVSAIQNETVVSIAAGSLTSYAVTATGKVYQWGLIHRDSPRALDDHEAAASGQLTGMAADQANTVVQVDHEARAHRDHVSDQASPSSAGSRASNGQNRNASAAPRARVLRDIVLDSTERWMLANDGADQEYYRELKSIGYQNEEVEQMMQNRGREYHGMLRMGCRRAPCFVPELIHLPLKVRIASVAAGYAHCMLLTVHGQLYGAGYNDRGQLGLGHRINTSEFKHVDFLQGKVVLQVACGQQHTICRAIDNPHFNGHTKASSLGNAAIGGDVGCNVAGDAYVWGNGMLGQLGLGRRGTSKGRLLPTLLSSLHVRYPAGIVDVSAGGNFTVVVTFDGNVYSFGHSEYNQHGTGTHAQTDYIDPFHFYEPQRLEILNPDAVIRIPRNGKAKEEEVHATWARTGTSIAAAANQPGATSVIQGDGGKEGDCESDDRVRIVRVSCGSNFTIGIDTLGDVYSWGWHECGVLGHGSGFFSSAPRRIDSLGHKHDGKTVIAVSAGAKHVLALTEVQSNSWAGSYRHMLSETSMAGTRDLANSPGNKYADVRIVIDNPGTDTREFFAHSVVLAARSKYLRGYLRSAASEAEDNLKLEKLTEAFERRLADGDSKSISDTTVIDDDSSMMLTVTLSSPHANNITMQSLLEYLYLDRLAVPVHKKSQLAELARELCLHRLVWMCTKRPFEKASPEVSENRKSGKWTSTSWSTFTSDMEAVINDEFCDVVFVASLEALQDPSGSATATATATAQVQVPVLYAHQAVLSKIPYFDALFSNKFSENIVRANSTLESDYHNMHAHAAHARTRTSRSHFLKRKMITVNADSLAADGVDVDSLIQLVGYAYTGEILDPRTLRYRGGEVDPGMLSYPSYTKDEEEQTEAPPPQLLKLKRSSSSTSRQQQQYETDVIGLLVAANRAGFTLLALQCERMISLGLAGNSDVTQALDVLAFAEAYGFPRLEMQCRELLKAGNSSGNGVSESHATSSASAADAASAMVF